MAVNAPHYVANIVVPVDPPVFPGPGILPQALSDLERALYQRRYPAIRTRTREREEPRISTYNFRIPPDDGARASLQYLESVHSRQAHGYKVNASVGAILAHKVSGRIRYFHASANNYRLLPEPAIVQSVEDLRALQNFADDRSWTDHVGGLMPDSAWRVVWVCNVQFVLYHDLGAYIRGPERQRRLRGLSRDHQDHQQTDFRQRLCVFHCLAEADAQRGATGSVAARTRRYFECWWTSTRGYAPMEEYQGLTMDQLSSVENMFSTGFRVYTIGDRGEPDAGAARLLRRPMPGLSRIIDVHLEGDSHFETIASMEEYARAFKCLHCGSLWSSAWRLRIHQDACSRASAYQYRGGIYEPRPRFHDLLGRLGIVVAPEDRYYPYRATFDLEACLTRPRPGVATMFTTVHVPMSVSLASNVPGHEGPYNFVSEGDPQEMVDRMMARLWAMSDEAYRLMLERMEPYLAQLATREFRHGKETEAAFEEHSDDEVGEMVAGRMMSGSQGARALAKARSHLDHWMRCLPVVSFNGGRYDLQLIKPHLAAIYATTEPKWLRRFRGYDAGPSSTPESVAEEEVEEAYDEEGPRDVRAQEGAEDQDQITSILKKGQRYTAIFTRKLAFLDVCNYLPAGGFTYAKYLRNYGGAACQAGKSFFPYEYVDDLARLRDPLPPYEAFYSSLRQGNTLEEGQGPARGRENYAELRRLWERQGMTSLRDLLVYYNNCDVVPFLTALQAQCDLYREQELDMLKDGPSLPSIGLRYGMRDAEGLFHTFGPDQSELGALMSTAIVGGPSIVFKRHAEAGVTTIRTPDYGAGAAPCRALVGYDANSLYPWAMAQDMPIGACRVRSEPDFASDDGDRHGGEGTPPAPGGPRHSKAALQWLAYEARVRGLEGMLHAGNGPEVRLGLRHLPVDGYHPDSATVFQFHGCLFHGHACRDFRDDWLGTSAQERRQRTEEIATYLTETCGYALVTIWECEWERLKTTAGPAADSVVEPPPAPPLPASRLPTPGADMETILQAIREDRIFGLAQVDLHTPEELKPRFRDLPPIFKTATVSLADAGPHMQAFVQEHGARCPPRATLVSSYYACQVLLPTPLLRWYLLNGLVVTRLYRLLQYDRRRCFQSLAEDCAQKRRDAQRDPSQALVGECAKLLMTSVYGKCCENKSRFLCTYFVKGSAASKAVRSRRFRDMKALTAEPLAEAAHAARSNPDFDVEDLFADGWEPEDDDGPVAADGLYELAMAPERLTADLPVQIAVFVYAYAKLRMLQFRYDLLGEFLDLRLWEPLYSDTDSLYMALGGRDLHDCLLPERKRDFYRQHHLWFPSEACDAHRAEFVETMTRLGPRAWYPPRQCCAERRLYDEKTPGLFKTEWRGDGMIALCSKTYYCRNSEGGDKLSTKGLQKAPNADALTFEAYRRVLSTGQGPSGLANRGIRLGPGGRLYTYRQERAALSYLYIKRRVAGDGIHTEPLDL